MKLEQVSHKLHETTYINTEQEKELALYKNWFDNNTTDVWRHIRMLGVLNPFLKNNKNAKWVTIGDGHFGTSATYISKNDGDVLASDIDITLLKVAKENNMIKDFVFANAEKLPFEDNQFNYSYCKLAYHHFPRPTLAVYEMLRVSSDAVIFTEPNDYFPPPFTRRILQKIKHFLKRSLGKQVAHHDTGNFETIGNYIYNISVRDFEKIAQGLGLKCIAYKKFHDAYYEGAEYEKWSESAPLYKKIKKNIRKNNRLRKLKLANPNNIQMIVFKSDPDKNILSDLKSDGYTICVFPKNPYL